MFGHALGHRATPHLAYEALEVLVKLLETADIAVGLQRHFV